MRSWNGHFAKKQRLYITNNEILQCVAAIDKLKQHRRLTQWSFWWSSRLRIGSRHWGRGPAWSSAARRPARRRRPGGRAPPASRRSSRAAACPTRAERSWGLALPARAPAPHNTSAPGTRHRSHRRRRAPTTRVSARKASASQTPPTDRGGYRSRTRGCAVRYYNATALALTRPAWGTRDRSRERTTGIRGTCRLTSFNVVKLGINVFGVYPR